MCVRLGRTLIGRIAAGPKRTAPAFIAAGLQLLQGSTSRFHSVPIGGRSRPLAMDGELVQSYSYS